MFSLLAPAYAKKYGVDDQELESQVADQTDSNLEVEGAFEREADGAATDQEISKASGDDLA